MSGESAGQAPGARAEGPEASHDAQALRQLRARAEQQAAVAQLSQRALAFPEPGEMFDAAVHLCARALEAQIVVLAEHLAESGELRFLSGLGVPLTPGATLPRDRFPIPARTILTGASIRVDDWRRPEHAELISPLILSGAVRSSAGVPLVRHGAAVGALVAHRAEPRPFDEQDESFLQSIANVLAAYEERRALFTRLQLSDRLAAVGTLASGVAHEMNNPLTYVLANLQFLDEELQALSTPARTLREGELRRALEALREAREGAQRLSTIVRDLRTFSSGDSEIPTLVSLLPVVLSSVNVAQNELRMRAQLALDLAPVPMLRGNAARLGQVCLNLLVNATQAIAPGDPDANRVSVRTRALPDGEVLLEIADTGSGIEPGHLKRLFDPFFTTKPPGVGTGLGLAICHGVVEKMGGRIEVESALGRGSTFRVYFPAASSASAVPPAEAPRPQRGRLLLVDDEPVLGLSLRRALIADHDVVLVQSARAALEQLASQEPFDALISSVAMPEMSGLELHEQLTRERPALARRTLLLAGGGLSPEARASLAQPGLQVLEKPIKVDELRRAVAKLVF